ncbi:isochorismatase family protein [Saccharopolyspora sp. K220]|uniref:isochorismatase family protein n=1 Tax=Saccharopolyspora soli TaxID=2926618 RepID=UPI001F59D347|nr:isochorismatase family protein [Saccharopolyspora soli]MCI2421379.1 isochorismatase family protein [Saccharopolyspora soli]
MTDPTELTIENSALVLIDHQPWLTFTLETDSTHLVNNVTAAARAAKAVGVPTVLTTVAARGSLLADPIFKEIQDIFPDVTPIDRTTTAAWSDPNFRDAVLATGRKKLVMAGLSTEVCLAQAVLAALKDGFEVYILTDCSAGLTKDAHEDAKTRMIQAGAKPLNVAALLCEWTPEINSPERNLVTEALLQHGGTSLAVQYVMAQVSAGIVSAPDAA